MAESTGSPARVSAALGAFCACTVIFLVYRDLCLPSVRDTEVWLGFEVHGEVARISAVLHWGLYAVGAWAFWHERDWVWSAATIYAGYIAVSHLIWNLVSPAGGGWSAGLAQLALFSVPALALYRLGGALRSRADPRPPHDSA